MIDVCIPSLIASLAVAAATPTPTPFEDTRSRFSLDLPDGWAFAPMPGDLSGASFRKSDEGVPALLTVRVWDFEGGMNLAQFADMVDMASRAEPGYRLLRQEPITLGGEPALLRRFVMYIGGDAAWSKMVEQRMMVSGRHGYLLHAESVAEGFGLFELDIAEIAASFLPGPRLELVRIDARGEGSFGAHSPIGLWRGGGHLVELSPSGVCRIDTQHGRYRIKEGVLLLELGHTILVVGFDFDGGRLRLRGGPFGPGVLLERGSGDAQRRRADPAQEPPSSPAHEPAPPVVPAPRSPDRKRVDR